MLQKSSVSTGCAVHCLHRTDSNTCMYCCFVLFNRFIHNMLHYRVILHVLVYTLLYNDLVFCSLFKSVDLTNSVKTVKYLFTSLLFVGGGANPSFGRYVFYHGASEGFQ